MFHTPENSEKLLENVRVCTVTAFFTIIFLASQLMQLMGGELINLDPFFQFRSVLSFLRGFIKFAFSTSARVKSYNQMLPASLLSAQSKILWGGEFSGEMPSTEFHGDSRGISRFNIPPPSFSFTHTL